ncbi:hypothetical protein BX070DRAFT_219389 [Coemansia spiralis]|nr:hypothetical protein BX070DRAFT_219389 [Coemansia spiralis]
MWKQKLRQLSGQSEGVPPTICRKRFNSTHKSKKQNGDQYSLHRTWSTPGYSCSSKDRLELDNNLFSGYATDPEELLCKDARSQKEDQVGLLDIVHTAHTPAITYSCASSKLSWSAKQEKPHTVYEDKLGRLLSRLHRSRQTQNNKAGDIAAVSVQNTLSAFGLDDGIQHAFWQSHRAHQKECDSLRKRPDNKGSSVYAHRLRSKECNSVRPWSKKEEKALLDYVRNRYGQALIAWDKVAAKFDRTGVGCMAKYYSLDIRQGMDVL